MAKELESKSTPKQPAGPESKQVKIQVKYEDLTARYANHVLLNPGQEEIYLDFSSGMIPDQGNGVTTMPIHTRIAMTAGGARRLYSALQQLFTKLDASKAAAGK